MRMILVALAVVGAVFISASLFLNLVPPRTVSIAAGAPGSAYYAIAKRYEMHLAVDGIEVEILESAGSVENVKALVAGADVALVQGGVPIPEDANINALAGVFVEPLLIFTRGSGDIAADPAQWEDLTLAIGGRGSGTRAAVLSLLNRLDLPTPSTAQPLGGADAVEALQRGEIDAALFVAPLSAPYLATLFDDPNIVLTGLRDAQAVQRHMPSMHLRTLPRGALAYAEPQPAESVDLVTTTARLVARADLHPAVVDRLIKAARAIHGDGDVLTRPGEFPVVSSGPLPNNHQAESLLKSPPSTLDRFVPYWIAAQISKVAILLLPILIVLLPLFRLLPGIYSWQMRPRVYKRYSELIAIETEAASATGGDQIASLSARLDSIEDDLQEMSLPEAYREYAYTMRLHIELVRSKLTALARG